MKPDMQSEQHTALFSDNSQAKILHKIEREITETLTSWIKMERDLSIFLDRSCKSVWLAIEYSYRESEKEREREIYRFQSKENVKRKRN